MRKHLAVFEALGSSGFSGLWRTNGTRRGTSELNVARAGPRGLFHKVNHPGFTAFGSKVLFEGKNLYGRHGLWATNGKTAGTSELRRVAGANLGGLSPRFFKVFGSEVLFNGTDTTGQRALWATDGTVAGTTELAGRRSEVDPDTFAVLGSKVLFAAHTGRPGLWVTDGTSAGTARITAAVVPSAFTVVGSKALFSSGGLWVTDGTRAGTSELVQISALNLTAFGNKVLFVASHPGNPFGTDLWVTNGKAGHTLELKVAGASDSGLDPDGFAALGRKVLFNGVDASGDLNLWVTNGTSAGTSELSVPGAASSGLNPGNSIIGAGPGPATIAVLGSSALFAGYDASRLDGLWVSDGTAAGTSELSVAGASPSGLRPSGFTAFGSKMLFEGFDSSGRTNLWATDGTSAGTVALNAFNASGFKPLGRKALFSAHGISGPNQLGQNQLWVTNGTAAGTHELMGGSNPQFITPFVHHRGSSSHGTPSTPQGGDTSGGTGAIATPPPPVTLADGGYGAPNAFAPATGNAFSAASGNSSLIGGSGDGVPVASPAITSGLPPPGFPSGLASGMQNWTGGDPQSVVGYAANAIGSQAMNSGFTLTTLADGTRITTESIAH